MPKEPFKVGDRVSVYYVGCPDKNWGTINEVVLHSVYQALRLLIDLDSGAKGISAHPKQCRRLIKKEKRRFLLWKNDIEFLSRRHEDCEACTASLIPYDKDTAADDEWIELVEVKKI